MSDTTSKVLAFAILLAQSASVPSGAYGGVTGLDSLGRAMCTLVDQSVSLLLFYGLVNLCFFPDSKRGLARMNMIHTARPSKNLKQILVNYRASWLDIGNLTVRCGEFKLGSGGSRGGSPNVDDPEGQIPDLTVAPNSNHWMYPYIVGTQPHEKGPRDVQRDPKRSVGEVILTRRALIRTTALAVARFAILLASSMLLTIAHVLIIVYFYEGFWIRTLVIVGDIGRWLLVVGQLSSVMTYSLDYKGICTWASPKGWKIDSEYNERWSDGEQLFCRHEVLRYIGRGYHARLVFLACEQLWLILSPLIPSKFQYIWGAGGLFSSFTTFRDEYFRTSQITHLELVVKPRAPGELCGDLEDDESYFIDFTVPTVLVQHCFSKRLVASPTQRIVNFTVMAIPCLCSLSVPYALVWTDVDSKLPALIILGIIQILTAVLSYKDIDDWSINCKFQVDSQHHATGSSLRSNIDPSTQTAGGYPPTSNITGGITHRLRSHF